jgi:probable F420-dependent oxidoreductase
MSGSIVPEGRLVWGMQMPIQMLSQSLREPWEVDATVADLVAVAQAADAAGAFFGSSCDHVAVPLNDYTRHMTPEWFDPFATLGFLAAHTQTMRLLSSVVIASYRHPLVTSKAFLTLDHLSGGRAVLGLGTGHVEGEFDALDVSFAERGAITNETVDAVRAAFESEYSSFSGEHFAYEGMGQRPRPVNGTIPIWIGGSSKPALRRVAERGDGWIPQGTPRAKMKECVDYIRSHRDKARPGHPLDLGFFPEFVYVGDASWDLGPYRLTGSPEAIAESMREATTYGCNVLHVHFRSRDRHELTDQITRFGAEVAPLLND